jgi:hypothetical protein
MYRAFHPVNLPEIEHVFTSTVSLADNRTCFLSALKPVRGRGVWGEGQKRFGYGYASEGEGFEVRGIPHQDAICKNHMALA